MSGFIEMKNGKCHEFHMGEIPNYIIGSRIDEVCSLQLDGTELEHVYRFFNNIPFSQVRIQVWRGDMAKFIIENW
jgi:hypothetical protein